ncbi:MAG: LPS export ABC transporter permease LptF [Sideroxydans sp.]|nr:LPS export ABC transporter permease LptF [Sideroxydans sp.]
MPDYPQSTEQKSKKPRKRKAHGIFYWSLVREFAVMGLLVFSVLLGIVVFTQLIRFLGESVSGLLAVDGILVMLGFSALNYLPVLLSISLFLSVLISLSRCYRDSEMVVWFSSGVGLTRWIRPVLGYAVPVALLIASLSLIISPWALSKADEFKRRLDSRDDVSAATPGAFRESKQADRVFFLEDVDAEKKRVGNIFVQSVQNGKEGTMLAKEGYQETAVNGDRFLVLINGTRYEGIPGQANFKIAEFERYAMRIEPVELRQEAPNLKARSTLYLLQNPTAWNMSELEWRVGLPLSALILALLAIPLSFVDPRAGRSLNLITAVIVYMIYNNMISVTNSWVAHEKISVMAGLWGIHLVMFAILLAMFYHRISMRPWQWWKR